MSLEQCCQLFYLDIRLFFSGVKFLLAKVEQQKINLVLPN